MKRIPNVLLASSVLGLAVLAGAVASPPAMLSVIPPVERRPVAALNLGGNVGQSLNLETTPALDTAPNWLPLDSLTLTDLGRFYIDVSDSLLPQRYRAWQAQPATTPPSMQVHIVPAITLTGSIGSAVRVDYINQFGPTDAWVTLATVALTNPPQLYFDTSTIGQPPRLYRLVPQP
jgi:hypothetical protein